MAAENSYCAYGGAWEFWRCPDRWVLFDGPAGTGKTRAVIEKSYALACEFTGLRVLWLRKTRASMTETVLEIFENKVCPDPRIVALSSVARHVRSHYHLRNGSRIVLGGLDNVSRIMSAEYDIICVFEATEITQEDWEGLDTRLRNGKGPYHQMVAECNPGPPGHWLKQLADAKKLTRILSRHSDNPACTPEYLASLQRLTGHRKARLCDGVWTQAEGLVYAEFDEACHVKQLAGPFSRAVIAIDDGFTNPASVGLYLLDNDGRAYKAAECYGSGMLHKAIVDKAQEFRQRAESDYKVEVEAVIVDPSAAKLIAECAAGGLPVTGADNDVDDGIKSVRDLLAVPADKLQRLTISPDCVSTIREFGLYAWAKDASGHVKDKPQKKDDHAMDELRYFAQYARQTSRSMEVIAL